MLLLQMGACLSAALQVARLPAACIRNACSLHLWEHSGLFFLLHSYLRQRGYLPASVDLSAVFLAKQLKKLGISGTISTCRIFILFEGFFLHSAFLVCKQGTFMASYSSVSVFYRGYLCHWHLFFFAQVHPRTDITLVYSALSSFLAMRKQYSGMRFKVTAHKHAQETREHVFLLLTHF